MVVSCFLVSHVVSITCRRFISIQGTVSTVPIGGISILASPVMGATSVGRHSSSGNAFLRGLS